MASNPSPVVINAITRIREEEIRIFIIHFQAIIHTGWMALSGTAHAFAAFCKSAGGALQLEQTVVI